MYYKMKEVYEEAYISFHFCSYVPGKKVNSK